ncbi:MAG: flippase [Acidobacteriia bacterium]|nr:flippase [Terriglobia bacterium]
MGQARSFLVNFTVLAIGDLAAKALAFWAFAHMARVVGTELFGDVAFAVAFTLYFGLIVSQGLDIYGIQELARDRSRVAAYTANILGLRLVSSLVAATALLITISLLTKPMPVKALMLLYGLTLITSVFSLQWVFQAFEKMKFVATGNVLGQLVFSALVLLFLKRPTQFLWIPVFQITGEVVSTLYLLFLFRRDIGPVHFNFKFHAWSKILKDSLPMGLSSVFTLIMINFDMVLLGFLKPASDVGQYSAAYKFIGFFSSFVLLYNRNLLPAVSRCKGNPSLLQHISKRTQKYTLLLSVPLAVGGAMVSRPLIRLVYGSRFSGGAVALAILIWIIPMTSSRVLYRVTLLSHGLQNYNLGVSLAAVLVNVTLNCLLIPRYSYVGSAVATVISELLLLLLTYAGVRRKVTALPLMGHLWKPVLASLAMAGFLYWCKGAGISVRILGGFVIYAAAGMMLKAFDIKEIRETLGWQ